MTMKKTLSFQVSALKTRQTQTPHTHQAACCCSAVTAAPWCVSVLQDQQLRGAGEPSEFPADPLCVRVDVSVRDQFGARQPLSPAVFSDGSPLLPRRLQSVQVQHTVCSTGSKGRLKATVDERPALETFLKEKLEAKSKHDDHNRNCLIQSETTGLWSCV